MRTEQQLEKAGFTESGRHRYLKTVGDYADDLFNRSEKYGELDKDKSSILEITHEHVRDAASSIVRTYGKDRLTRWTIVGQVGEYVFTAIAGVGAGNISTPWGILVFGLSIALAIILLVFRRSKVAR